MRWSPTLCAFTCLAAGAATLAGAAEPEDRWSRPQRTAGTQVVSPRAGSLPFDDDWSHAPVPVKRDHYLFSPEWMAQARAESYLSPDVPRAAAWSEGDAAASGVPLRSSAPPRKQTFDGLKRVTSTYQGTSGFPPDATIAVGPDKIIQATNVAIRMTTRNGMELDRLPLNNFLGFDDDNALFDPKVYFDRLSGRFFVVALELGFSPKKSGIWVAVSKNNNPSALSAPGSFCTYRINSKRGGSWGDYPTIGINEDRFAISVNNFKFSNGFFRKVFVYTMSVPQITNNGSSCPGLVVKRFPIRNDADGLPAFTVHPAQHYTPNNLPGNPLFMVSSSVFLPSPDYHVWRITTNAGGNPELSKGKQSGTFDFHVPPAAPQKGNAGDLDAGDMRITQAAFRDGKLWAVHGTACGIGDLPNESCVRAVEFTPSANDSPITFGETYGRMNEFLFWPGIAINQAGDVAVAFQRAKPTAFLGVSYNGKRAGADHFDSIRKLRTGSCSLRNYDQGLELNRTGDYLGLQTDPADNLSFWIAGEYPGDQGGGEGCDWKTRVGRAKY